MKEVFSSVGGKRSNMQRPVIVAFVGLLAVATATISTTAATTPKDSAVESAEEERCQKSIGEYNGDGFNGQQVIYDFFKILEEHGGPPGKVNATWFREEYGPVVGFDPDRRTKNEKRNDKFYRFRETDGKTYLRLEHAVRRFTAMGNERLDIDGTIYWSPPDFCGKLRKATYTLGESFYSFQLSQEYCWIVSPTIVRCAKPTTLYVHDGKEREGGFYPIPYAFGAGGSAGGASAVGPSAVGPSAVGGGAGGGSPGGGSFGGGNFGGGSDDGGSAVGGGAVGGSAGVGGYGGGNVGDGSAGGGSAGDGSAGGGSAGGGSAGGESAGGGSAGGKV